MNENTQENTKEAITPIKNSESLQALALKYEREIELLKQKALDWENAAIAEKLKKWKNISLDFTSELITEWENKRFSYERTADWINIGFTVKDADYAWWLEKGVEYDPLKYLNETSPEDQAGLKEQFEEYKQSK